jgi:hypothetical protein
VYAAVLPNFQKISKKLVDYYSQSINKMPEGLRANIELSLKSHSDYGTLFSLDDVNRTVKCLKFCFNFRPDIGFRPGLEYFVLALKTSKFTLKRCAITMFDFILVSPLFRALIKGDLVTIKSYIFILKREIEKRLPRMTPFMDTLEMQFQQHSVNFFIDFFSIKSLRKIIDLLIIFGDEVFIFLFIEILAQQKGNFQKFFSPLDNIVLNKAQQGVILDNLRVFLVDIFDKKSESVWIQHA